MTDWKQNQNVSVGFACCIGASASLCLWLIAKKWLKISHTMIQNIFKMMSTLEFLPSKTGISAVEPLMMKGLTCALRCVAVIIGFPVVTGDGPAFLSSLVTQWEAPSYKLIEVEELR